MRSRKISTGYKTDIRISLCVRRCFSRIEFARRLTEVDDGDYRASSNDSQAFDAESNPTNALPSFS